MKSKLLTTATDMRILTNAFSHSYFNQFASFLHTRYRSLVWNDLWRQQWICEYVQLFCPHPLSSHTFATYLRLLILHTRHTHTLIESFGLGLRKNDQYFNFSLSRICLPLALRVFSLLWFPSATGHSSAFNKQFVNASKSDFLWLHRPSHASRWHHLVCWAWSCLMFCKCGQIRAEIS